MSSKKAVVKLDLHDDKDKRRAMRAVSKIPRIDSIAVDMKAMKLTVVGDIDPITVVNKLRKYWAADIVSVGPAKEPEKKKEGDNKAGGGDPNKQKGNEAKGSNPILPYVVPLYPHVNPYMNYPQHVSSYYPPPPPPPMPASYEYGHEENPNSCVIC